MIAMFKTVHREKLEQSIDIFIVLQSYITIGTQLHHTAAQTSSDPKTIVFIGIDDE